MMSDFWTRWPARCLAAGMLLAATAAGVGIAAAIPAQASSPRLSPHSSTIAKETVTPNSNLASGQQVTVSISGYPPNTPVGLVECDERVVTTGNKGFCNSKNYSKLVTGASGAGSGTFTVYSGSNFTSDNGQGVCNKTNACYVVGDTYTLPSNDSTVSLGQVSFSGATVPGSGTSTSPTGTTTTTTTPATNTAVVHVHPSHATVRAGQRAQVEVTVWGAINVAAPTGSVTLLKGARTLASATLSPADTASLSAKLPAGRYRLTVRYSGDANYATASSVLSVTVRRHR
jgi:hypothetical protein